MMRRISDKKPYCSKDITDHLPNQIIQHERPDYLLQKDKTIYIVKNPKLPKKLALINQGNKNRISKSFSPNFAIIVYFS